MIPVDLRLCEIYEAATEKESEQEKATTFIDFAFQLMSITEKNFQNNHFLWSAEKQKLYGMRIPKYSNVIQALNAIKCGSKTNEILELGIKDSKSLFLESNIEYIDEWNSAGPDKRKKILENLLLPLMLISRFLQKVKTESI